MICIPKTELNTTLSFTSDYSPQKLQVGLVGWALQL